MRNVFRELYEIVAIFSFAIIATIFITVSDNELVQFAAFICVIASVATGKVTRVIKYFGEMIYKKT